MPFDGKASVVIVDENGAVKNIISENQVYKMGNVKMHKTNLEKIKGKAILIIDGEIAASAALK